jgi:hypothetical protein
MRAQPRGGHDQKTCRRTLDADNAVEFWRAHLERTEKKALTGRALSTVVDLLD